MRWRSPAESPITRNPAADAVIVPPLDHVRRRAFAGCALALALIVSGGTARAQPTVTIDPATHHQTMMGWEAVAEIGDLGFDDFEKWQAAALDAAAGLNINRLRLNVVSGAENPVDYFTQYKQGLITFSEYKLHRFEAINDNADPSVINPAGFHFSELDHRIDNIVTLLRQRLAARGEPLHVMLQFEDASRTMNPFEHSSSAAEYAELVLATYEHIHSKYGWQPASFSLENEPDNRGFWTATKMGNALVATGSRLAAAGFGQPPFVAPDCSTTSTALTFFDTMVGIPGVTTYLTDFAYHRYGVGAGDIAAIAQRAANRQIRTGMLEHIGSGYEDLYTDLTVGNVSSWEQYALAFPCNAQCGGDNGAQYLVIDRADPDHPQVVIGSRTKRLRQYFNYVHMGAVRIGAAGAAGLAPVAFINPDGAHVVVVQTSGASSFAIQGLPAGLYGVNYTTAAEFVDAADVAIAAGQPLNTSIPSAGAITVYGRPAPPTATASATGSATHTRTPSATRTRTATATRTGTATRTTTALATPISTPTASVTAAKTPPPTVTADATGTTTVSGSATPTDTVAHASETPSALPSDTSVASATPSPPSDATATPSASPATPPPATESPLATASATPTPPGSATPTPSQSPTPLPSPPTGDLTGDGQVTGDDLVALIGALFQPAPPAAADLNDDGAVGGADIVGLLERLDAAPAALHLEPGLGPIGGRP
jgi:hypothetical protein